MRITHKIDGGGDDPSSEIPLVATLSTERELFLLCGISNIGHLLHWGYGSKPLSNEISF